MTTWPTIEEFRAHIEQQATVMPAPAQPAADDATRAATEAVRYLAALGFEEAALRPDWQHIPQEWQAQLRDYCDSVAANARAGLGISVTSLPGRGKSCVLALVALAGRAADLTCAYSLCGADLVWACEQRDSRARAKAMSFDTDETFDPDRKPWPYQDTDLLLLDDLDLGKGVGFDPERDHWDVVGRFLYARMARGLATCIASNLPWGAPGEGDKPGSGLCGKPGLARVVSRWHVRIPPQYRLATRRADQRGAMA